MRLLLISLDAVCAADAAMLLSLPHLGDLARRGVFCDQVRTIYPTLTYPIHASIITGCYPERHGILHNELFMPRRPPGRRPWYWEARHIQADTLHQAAARAGREVASILWPTTGKYRGIRYNFPEALALPGESQVLKMLRQGSAAWILKNEILYGRTRPSIKQPHLDRYATLLLEKLIGKHYYPGMKVGSAGDVEPSARRKRQHMPDMMTIHLVDCDAARHAHGTDSPEAGAALIRLDEAVGRLLAALENVRALDQTIVAVVSDHGHEDVRGILALDEWLVVQGIPARAQTLGFGAYILCERGRRSYIEALLNEHKADLKLRHVYSRRELRDLRLGDGVDLAVEAEHGVEIVDTLDQRPSCATHGFGLDRPAAKVLMWLAGPPFREGVRLEAAEVVDIAPTLAKAAGLYLRDAQGRVLSEAFAGVH